MKLILEVRSKSSTAAVNSNHGRVSSFAGAFRDFAITKEE